MFKQNLILHATLAGTIMLLTLCVGVGAANEVGTLTDGRMEGAIERRLEMDSRIKSKSVGVTVKDRHVKLFGSVETLQERGHATQVASSVIGVNSVQNTIEVRPHPMQDQSIHKIISKRLKNEPLMQDEAIEIRVANQVVTLMGTVRNPNTLRQAQHLAESVEGVRKVENLLSVKDSKRPDKEIREDVLHYLLWSPLADLKNFNVSVSDGVVTLEGTVEHLIHKDVLSFDIEHIHGVKNVRVGKIIPRKFEISLKD